MSNIVLHPKISEKAIALAERGTYVFEVPTSTNKIEVARAVEAAFKVNVMSVNMLIVIGQNRSATKQVKGRQKDVKKAVVKKAAKARPEDRPVRGSKVMAIKLLQAHHPARRGMTTADTADLTKGRKPTRQLLVAKKAGSGRNNQGKITIRHRGGGVKRFYRLVDFDFKNVTIGPSLRRSSTTLTALLAHRARPPRLR